MAYSLGSAYVQVVPSFKGLSKSIEAEFSGAGDRASKGFGGKLFDGLKKGAVGAGIAIGGVLTTSVVKGFQRLTAIENAEAKLTGLGHSAQEVQGIMESTLKAVQGTAFGLDEAAGLSATLVASGIKPGKELENTLRLVADSATISGRSMEDMGLVWSQVASKGKLTGEDAMQFMEAGIPIWQMIGDQMGVTAGEAQEMASRGEVSFETFRAAMEKNLGGAALESGKTTEGAFRNMMAAVSRFGATLLSGVFPLIGPLFNGLTKGIDAANAALAPFLEKFTTGLTGVIDLLRTGEFTGPIFGFDQDAGFVNTLLSIRDVALEVWDALKQAVGGIDFSTIMAGLSPLVSGLSSLAPVLAEAWANLSPLKLAFDVLAPTLPIIGQALGQLATTLGELLGGALEAVLPAVTELMGALGLMWSELMASVIPAILDVANAIGTALVPIMESVGPLLSTIVGAVVPIFQDLVAAVGPVVTMVADFLAPILERVGAIFGRIVQAVTPLVGALLGLIGNVLRPLFQIVVQIVKNALAQLTPAFSAVLWVIGLLLPAFEWLAGFLAQVATVIGEVLGVALQWLADKFTWISGVVLGSIGPAMQWMQGVFSSVASWVTGTLVPALVGAWNAIAAGAQWLYTNVIQPVWNGIKVAIALAVAVIMTVIDGWMAIFRNVVAPVFQWLWTSVIQPVWNGIKTAISAVVDWFQNTAWPFIQATITRIQVRFEQFKAALQIAWKYIQFYVIQPVISWFQNTVWPLFQRVIGFIQNRFNDFKLGLQIIWGYIRNNVINPVVSWFQNTVAPLINEIIGRIKSYFTRFQVGLRIIWRDIQMNIVQPVLHWFENTLQPKIKTVTDTIKNAFTTMKDGIKTAWDAVKEAAKAPVRFVIDTVVNKGIVANFNKIADSFGVKKLPTVAAGFASGGVLPGYTPGRDVHDFYSPSLGRLSLSGGEAIMRPEWTRAVGGPAAVEAMNRRARHGMAFKSGGVFGAFKGGGVVDWIKDTGGDAIDWAKEKVDFAADVLTDPLGALKKLVDGLLVGVPGSGLIKDFASGMPKKLAKELGDKLASTFTGPAGDVPAGGGTGGSLGQTLALARSMGLVLTSAGRRGARTAQNGLVSLHALGRAHDYAGSPSAMMRFFNAVDARFNPTELLYSPAGRRNKHRSGRRYANTGATLRNHYSHVHVGFRDGGVIPKPYLHDKGGWHNPGDLSVNQTRQPEAVLTHRQWGLAADAIQAAVDSRGAGIQIGTVQGYTAQEVARAITTERRKQEALYAHI